MPKSTRANSFMPRFGFASSLIEENAYAPNKQGKINNNFLSFNKIQSDDKDNQSINNTVDGDISMFCISAPMTTGLTRAVFWIHEF